MKVDQEKLKIFRAFLKKHKVYESYNKNVEPCVNPFSNEMKFDVDPTGWITGTFIWENSEEDYWFWDKVNIKWHRELTKRTNE